MDPPLSSLAGQSVTVRLVPMARRAEEQGREQTRYALVVVWTRMADDHRGSLARIVEKNS
jgi:hypothetical protein